MYRHFKSIIYVSLNVVEKVRGVSLYGASRVEHVLAADPFVQSIPVLEKSIMPSRSASQDTECIAMHALQSVDPE